VVEWLEEHLW